MVIALQNIYHAQLGRVLSYTLSRLLLIIAVIGAALWLFVVGLSLELPGLNGEVFIHVVEGEHHGATLGVFASADYRLTQALIVFSSLESNVLGGLLTAWRYGIAILIGIVGLMLLLRIHRLALLILLIMLSSGAVLNETSLTLSVLSLFCSGLYLLLLIGFSNAVGIKFNADVPKEQKSSLIAYASQSGTAQGLAQQIAKISSQYCDIKAFSELTPNCLQRYQQLFVVASTYGDGQAPEKSHGFVEALAQCEQALPNLHFAVLALGDSTYPKFCAFGHQLAAMLRDKGAQALYPVHEIDRGHIASVSQWWSQVCQGLGWHSELMHQQWLTATIIDNQCLNPSQERRMAHLITLRVTGARYQAGDLLEVLTPLKRSVIELKLTALGLNPNCRVNLGEQVISLIDALTQLEWQQQTASQAQALVDQLSVLRPRVYSIASKPDDPVIALFVRRLVKDDGELGFSSARLCASQTDHEFKVSLRRHDSFRPPLNNVPMILICAGTGIAPFMSFLAQRQQLSFDAPIWLIFGEQYQDSGCYFKQQLDAYQRAGILTELSYAFSRDKAWLDQLKPRYVDDILLAQRERLCRLVNQQHGEIFVCGNALSLGGSVKKALSDILIEHYQTLLDNSRLHFDLY